MLLLYLEILSSNVNINIAIFMNLKHHTHIYSHAHTQTHLSLLHSLFSTHVEDSSLLRETEVMFIRKGGKEDKAILWRPSGERVGKKRK